MSRSSNRTTAGIITVAKIRSASADSWLTENWPKGEGTFQVRKLSGDRCVYYYRYTDASSKQQRITLPRYNEQGQPVTLAEARAEAKALARRHMLGDKNLRETLAYEQRKVTTASGRRGGIGTGLDKACPQQRSLRVSYYSLPSDIPSYPRRDITVSSRCSAVIRASAWQHSISSTFSGAAGWPSLSQTHSSAWPEPLFRDWATP